MNFTREPIIETVITAREGYKLSIHNSKKGGSEEYIVDAVEIVSFGHALFFRSQERPKSFLVPVSDYEVFEVKETRMVIKSATIERSIKIGGGKESAPRLEKEASEKREELSGDRRKDRRRSRRRREMEKKERQVQEVGVAAPSEAPLEKKEEKLLEKGEERQRDQEEVILPKTPRKILPPPSTLIKEKLSRYKESETFEEGLISEKREEKPSEEEKAPPEG